MIKKIVVAIVAVIVIVLAFRYCEFKHDDTDKTTFEEAGMIQEQIKNVGKLVVTEGHFSDVITYKNQASYFMDMVSFEKKAIVVVNTEASVSYDLSKIQYDVDEVNKIITIKSIPKEEIKINPEIKFYDVQQSTMNEFSSTDYNKINKQVKDLMRKKIEQSTLKTNAQNRLISELSKILILTNTMGWKLQYNGQQVQNENINTLL